MKHCSCGSTKNLYLHGSYTRKDGKITHHYRCKDCNTNTVKQYRHTAQGRAAKKKAKIAYESKPENKLRVKAWWIAQEQIALQPCEIDGKKDAHRHHPDPQKPEWVIFLCPFHHKQAHKQEKTADLT